MTLSVVLIILAMLLLNGVFAAYELALASVRTSRLKALADQKRRGAGIALRMKNRMEGSLAVVQLGITLVGAIAAATGGASIDEWLTANPLNGARFCRLQKQAQSHEIARRQVRKEGGRLRVNSPK